jgi:hypothetical protein
VLEADSVRKQARQRLFAALQAVHLRGETHITMRELRAALVYILFGVHYCDDYHANAGDRFLPYWDRAFDATSEARQGELLSELVRFDPALEAHPKIDRYLLREPLTEREKSAPQYPQLKLSSARRRAYFEWTGEQIEEVSDESDALDLAQGTHIHLFRNLALASQQELEQLCARLCQGIARLEDLPLQAFARKDVVPLRITPRTPTETAFWVEKPLSSFRLEVDLDDALHGAEQLQRHAYLIYHYHSGNLEERLRLGADLFHRLLELADGYQLGDVSTDDTFAHLSIFVQRLVLEDERTLLAWNPIQDESIFRLSTKIYQATDGPQQRMVITPERETSRGDGA